MHCRDQPVERGCVGARRASKHAIGQMQFANGSGTSKAQSRPSAGPSCLRKIVWWSRERYATRVKTRFFGGDCSVEANTLDSTLRDAAKFRRLPSHTFCDAHCGRDARNGGVQRRVVFWFMDRGRLRPPHLLHGPSKTPAQGVPQLSQRPSSVSFHDVMSYQLRPMTCDRQTWQ
jgi:hypothetical protein